MSIYLPNVYRTAFGLDSVVDVATAKAAAQKYVDRTGESIYIPGLGEIKAGSTPAPPTPVNPTKDTNPIIAGDSVEGSELTTSDGTFKGGNVAYTVKTIWQVSDTGSGNWAWVAGSGPFTLTATEVGKYIRANSNAEAESDGKTIASAASGPVGPVTAAGSKLKK